MLRTLAALIAITWFTASPAPGTIAAPQLRVSGNRLVDTATNQAFVPRGVNWPSFEYACFYGYGYSNAASATSVGPDAVDAALIASWHANTVRIPLNQDCWLGDDALPNATQGSALTAAGYRQAVQDWVALLHGHGLAVILDLHWSGPNGVPADGQRAMADARSAAFWASVAGTFKNDPAMMFDAFNEPFSAYQGNTLAFDLTWSCWRSGGCQAPRLNDTQAPDGKTFTTAGMEALVNVIRGVGATQPILLGGRDYSNDLGDWLSNRPQDDQLVASFHNYNTQLCNTAACWDSTIAPVAAQVPVVTGEFGETDCSETHDTSYMDWADRHGVGYLGWQWVVLDTTPTCADLALIHDATGTPQAPNGTALKAHLEALAAGATPAAPAPPTGTGTGTGTAPGATGEGPGSASRRVPVLSMRRPSFHRGRLRVRGSVTRGASEPLRIVVTYRLEGPRARRLTRSARSTSGTFALTLRLPHGARPRSVSVRFPGSASLQPRTVTRRIGRQQTGVAG